MPLSTEKSSGRMVKSWTCWALEIAFSFAFFKPYFSNFFKV